MRATCSAAVTALLLVLRVAGQASNDHEHQDNTFITAPSPSQLHSSSSSSSSYVDPEKSPFPPTINTGRPKMTAPTSTGSVTIETSKPSLSHPHSPPPTMSNSSPLPMFTTLPGHGSSGCACYTHTTFVQNPHCPPPSSMTCGPHPDCIVESVDTIPPPNKACPKTPTVTRTATTCYTDLCQHGCATTTRKAFVCPTHTTTTSPPIACPLMPVCPRPSCFGKTLSTVPPNWCGCTSTPTSTVTVKATCSSGCPTGCMDRIVTVTSTPI